MLQGDALSVQLFIAATAISALSVAMTQAGWTHRWFVRDMFGLTILLSIASIGWPYFQTRIPLLSDALQTVATTRLAWFVMGTAPAFVGGMLLSDAIRRRREGAENLIEWLPVLKAMDTLARNDLIDRYQYVVEQSAEASKRATALDEKIEQIEKSSIFVDESAMPGVSEEYAKLCRERDSQRKECMDWWQTFETCCEVLRDNIQTQLRQGHLLAKGFLVPHTPGAPEKIIPTEEWRFLSLDDKGDQALGPNFEYIAVLIGRPHN